ncbi:MULTISPECIES: hypothetical protein [Legionella]|uniref:hypothetical protein n=1 Tax=Legionella TaxID=445 RepID=UPI00095FF8BC|nr:MULTISPECIES: hypothetical protein [Legionella]MBN9226479.1 hypothetical protein [Legionella steelei]OJW12211.1 MAG: hypothetical protein BGO44_04060 [Legionella sp. 39-23]
MKTANRNHKSHVRAAASDLLDEGKKWANEVREEGVNTVNKAEENIKRYSDQTLKKVHEYPLVSVLLAGGIGYLLAKILKK